MFIISPKITQIGPKMLKIKQIDPKISQICVNYRKNPINDKTRWSYPQNPTDGPQTYWAPRAQVPQQFAALDILLLRPGWSFSLKLC